MRISDLHELPKIRDKLSYLYVEHCRIDQEAKAIAIHDAMGVSPVPCANLALLMLGPGTNITHAAVLALADNGCLVVWCGEQGVRFYASGMGETRNAANLLRQAHLCTHRQTRLLVVKRMYALRFAEPLSPSLTLQQIRGMEGVRVRTAYSRASAEWGVPWEGRTYDRGNWKNADPVNRALSTANACLYGVCHAAIVAAGYSPALGFVHTGKQLSFVYDVADFYKADITIPVAFQVAAVGTKDLERNVRLRCRDMFAERQLLKVIMEDIEDVLGVPPVAEDDDIADFDSDPATPGGLWDPEQGEVAGGVQYDPAAEQELKE